MSADLAEIFTRKIRTASLSATPAQHVISANENECAALAAVFGLPGIAALTGNFSLTANRQNSIIDAELTLQAKLTQTCVISLEPFDAVIHETAHLQFVPAASIAETAEIAELAEETLEAPDEIPYTGDAIDLGAALAEQLALALDPYPRKPGAELPAPTPEPPANPFAALATRRNGV